MANIKLVMNMKAAMQLLRIKKSFSDIIHLVKTLKNSETSKIEIKHCIRKNFAFISAGRCVNILTYVTACIV